MHYYVKCFTGNKAQGEMMPIKSFTFAFKLDAKELLSYVVEKNIAVDIHATGTKRQEQEATELPSPASMLALPAPRPIVGRRTLGGRIGSKAVVLFYLAAHKRASCNELKVALVEAGYRASSCDGLLWSLKTKKLVARSPQGYRILNKGLKMLDAEVE
jgi:hypothetical protein